MHGVAELPAAAARAIALSPLPLPFRRDQIGLPSGSENEKTKKIMIKRLHQNLLPVVHTDNVRTRMYECIRIHMYSSRTCDIPGYRPICRWNKSNEINRNDNVYVENK